MGNLTKKHIFFVGNETNAWKMADSSLQQAGYNVRRFSRISDCLEQLSSRYPCDLLTVDVKKMLEMDGLELLKKVKCIIPSLPVLILTGYGDIQIAVRALKAGASDFIEKPLKSESFLSTVELTLKGNTRTHPLISKALTKTEMKILRLILDGKSNKEIAYLLHRSVRTIEVHRSHIMRKLGVDNVVHLVEKSIAMRLVELPASKY